VPSRCLLIILDGLGDRTHESLGGRTPLAAARTPHLDELARLGANGLFHAGELGLALPSEDAHFALFGYQAEEFPGRGLLEALGAGLEVRPGEVYLLARLLAAAEEDGGLRVLAFEPPWARPEAEELFSSLAALRDQHPDLTLSRTKGLEAILTLRGPASPWLTDSSPLVEGRYLMEVQPWREWAEDEATLAAAGSINDFLISAHRSLRGHPVNLERQRRGLPPLNALATQRPGRLREVRPFKERWGLRAATVSSGLVYWGLARFLGLEVIARKDTADPAADLAGRLEAARRLLADFDLVHVHTKAPDQAAHTKNPAAKREVIEALDQGLGRAIGPLLDDPEVLLVVTSDHSTPSAGPLIHSGEPVPLLMAGRGVRRDGVSRFDEVSAAAGVLGLVRGRELMNLILNHLNRAKLRGLMDGPEDQPFWPGPRRPLKV